MKSRIFSILLMFQLLDFGCTNHNNVRYKLTKGSVHFWGIYDSKSRIVTGSYSFDVSGGCFYYTNNRQGKRHRIYDDDLVYPHTWAFKGDSVLNILGIDRKVLRFTDDSLILQNNITKEIIILTSSQK